MRRNIEELLRGQSVVDETDPEVHPSLIFTLLPSRSSVRWPSVTTDFIKAMGGVVWVTTLYISLYAPVYTITRCQYVVRNDIPTIRLTRHPKDVLNTNIDRRIADSSIGKSGVFLPHYLAMRRFSDLHNDIFDKGGAPIWSILFSSVWGV